MTELDSVEAPLVADPQVLYRMYDARGRLLYVGITSNVEGRLDQHRAGKPWWPTVSTIKLEHFGSRPDVEAAEREAIVNERPRYNIVHRWRESAVGVKLRSPMRHRNFRIRDETWFAFARISELRGEHTSTAMRRLIAEYVEKNRKLLDDDPVWQKRLADRAAGLPVD